MTRNAKFLTVPIFKKNITSDTRITLVALTISTASDGSESAHDGLETVLIKKLHCKGNIGPNSLNLISLFTIELKLFLELDV